MYDAHTHLNTDPLFNDRKSHLTTFSDNGGRGLVNIGMDHLHNIQAVNIAKEAKTSHPHIHIGATVGVHPCEISFDTITTKKEISQEINKLRELYQQEKEHISAIGECGIDSHHAWNTNIAQLQQELFTQQCHFAREVHLPVIIHSRSNFPLTYSILKEFTDLRIYLHCRGYGIEELQQSIDTFPQLWIGFCGNLTYPKARTIQESFAYYLHYLQQNNTSHHYILLETDAPYLSPQNVRGQKNCPAFISYVYEWAQNNHPTSNITELTRHGFYTLYVN